MVRTVTGFILSPFFYILFGLLLLIFHPIQVIARKTGGYHAHKKSVGVLNFLLVKLLYILGCTLQFNGLEKIPADKPLIVVSNHQSIFDIQACVHAFDKWHPKFVSKIELAKNIPSISYNLVHGGSALIDRKSGAQSIKEIMKLGKLINENNYAAIIYPEGTRSRSGKVKKFQSAGLKSLLRAAPRALVVPFVIKGHSELMKNGYFPLTTGVKISYTALGPIDPAGKESSEIAETCEKLIKAAL
ncbi:lysophospholipid acyltransferase family protein [Marinilabiliaceae bacterium ANBcel2]|nr:lysophospholipid acyltransferase family protein [Marinilabiliaceae bacterium ANBcel2]